MFGVVLPYAILTLAFTFFYCFIPNTKVNIKAALIGGLTTAFLWKLMGWGFSSFVANSASKAAIYSAFATIIVFMVWIYLVWLVLLIGASISFYLQYPELRRIRHRHYQLSPATQEALALQVMSEIASRFLHGKTTTTSCLSNQIQVPHKAVDVIACKLKHHGLITNEQETGAWLLTKPAESISQYDILAAIRASEGQPEVQSEVVDAHKTTMADALEKQFGKVTLKSLVDKLK